MKNRVEVNSERTVVTYSEFWYTSTVLLRISDEFEEESHHLIMSSLVFTAFSLEAFLNHIGPKIFKCWDDLEKLSPKEKINIITEKLDIKVDYAKYPWQILKELFQFRNDIAHGKSTHLSKTEIQLLENHNKYFQIHNLRNYTRWEKFCTKSNAEKSRAEVLRIISTIFEKLAITDEYPLQMGFEIKGSTLLSD